MNCTPSAPAASCYQNHTKATSRHVLAVRQQRHRAPARSKNEPRLASKLLKRSVRSTSRNTTDYVIMTTIKFKTV